MCKAALFAWLPAILYFFSNHLFYLTKKPPDWRFLFVPHREQR